MLDEPIIYRLDDEISFRKCSLFEDDQLLRGDCTNYSVKEIHWNNHYHCNQNGIHLHCTKHPAIELTVENTGLVSYLICPKCQNKITVNYRETISKCLRLVNMERFKNAKLIRLDDWYVPELKEKIETDSDYWLKVDVKTDKDGDTIIVLYVGYKGSKDKTQFFIKPEKLQLSSDHKDLDPTQVLSKIEVALKGRKLMQIYEDEKM